MTGVEKDVALHYLCHGAVQADALKKRKTEREAGARRALRLLHNRWVPVHSSQEIPPSSRLYSQRQEKPLTSCFPYPHTRSVSVSPSTRDASTNTWSFSRSWGRKLTGTRLVSNALSMTTGSRESSATKTSAREAYLLTYCVTMIKSFFAQATAATPTYSQSLRERPLA